MNEKETQGFDVPEINEITNQKGIIPADSVTTDQKLAIPNVNLANSAPDANQALTEASAQVESQTKLDELTNQRIADTRAQRSEQESLIAALGEQGGEIQTAFQQGQEALKPIEKEVMDLTSLINTKTQAIQNQLIDESGRRIPQAFITGRQAIIQQRGTAELSALGALLDAKNGQIELAQTKIENSLKILESVQATEIAQKEAKVALRKEITGESRVDEENELTRLKEEQAKFEAERDDISSIALQAMQAGAGAGEISAITNAKSKDEAIAAAKSLGRAAKLAEQIQRQTIAKNSIAMQVAKAKALQESAPEQAESKRQASKSTLDLVSGMIGNKLGFIESVGTNKLGRTGLFNTLSGGKQDKFIANAKTLTAKDTLNSLIDVKAQGATFGALSDGERQLVAQAANSLAGFAIYDNEGNPTGKFKGGESDVFEAMEVIQQSAAKSYFRNGGTVTPELKPIADSLANEYIEEVGSILQTNEYESAGY